jgi:predicted DNA-binding protein
MSEDLNRRLRIAAAHEDMSKTTFIREVLGVAIDDLETNGLDAFREQHGTESSRAEGESR